MNATDGKKAIADNRKDLCTMDQWYYIQTLASELEVNADQASRSLFETDVENLSKSGADDLMEYLENLKNG